MLGSRSGGVRDKVEHVGCAVEAVESPAHNLFEAAPTPQRKRPDQIDQARPRGALRSPMTQTATTASAPQHLRALERANTVRLARAELKRRVAAGDTLAAKVVVEAPWEAQSMTIADLITSQSRWGRARCRRLLQSIPISEQKTIGSMTERQRHALAAALPSD